MPAKFVRRSAIGQPFMNLLCRSHTLRRGIHDFGAPVRAITTYENFRVMLGDLQFLTFSLADRDDHHVARNELVTLRRANLDARGRAVAVAHDALRCGLESKSTAVALR